MQTASPVTLDALGDVLTDDELAALVRRSPQWPKKERWRARRLGCAPNLPRELSDVSERVHRYRKQDVAQWLANGSRGRS